jgi:hypothetical protein
MRQHLILHVPTRVIRRVTVDSAPEIATDETVVLVDTDPIDLAGIKVLDADGVSIRQATAQEIDDADLDAVKHADRVRTFMMNYLASLDAIGAASTTAQMQSALKDWAARHKNLTLNLFR